MRIPSRKWVILGLAGLAVAVVSVIMLLNLRSTQPLRYRVDLNRRGDELRTVTLYFLEADSLKLVPVRREVLAGRSRRELAQDLVTHLARPLEPLRAPLPPGTRLLHFFENGSGEVVLNFNAQIEYLSGEGIGEERLRLSALTRTLAENVSGVRRVRLLVLGRALERWGSHLEPVGALEVGS
jgi:spore germination protein GerM